MKIVKIAFTFLLLAAFGIYLWNRVGVEEKDSTFYCYYVTSLAIIGYLTIKWTDAEQKLRRILDQLENED
ncbi:hypothetical protein [Halioxenophilus aromaticivorans]|uniref:YiaAB two helix domain-containing protein n=1 Tax=Halioxenophilus aromaticivorans TaxID=1306992 RepID=A0AAV3U313_9ALTE